MGSLNPAQRQVLDLLEGYHCEFTDSSAICTLFRDFVSTQPECCERTLSIGHLTGSAWLVSENGERVLLTHHRKLNRWLQLGGHADGDSDLMGVALREAEEESGLTGLSIEPVVFDLDRHEIPARGDDPEHWHYDVRFIVRASDDEAFVVSEESHNLAWRSIAEIARDPHADQSVQRMAVKWLLRIAMKE